MKGQLHPALLDLVRLYPDSDDEEGVAHSPLMPIKQTPGSSAAHRPGEAPHDALVQPCGMLHGDGEQAGCADHWSPCRDNDPKERDVRRVREVAEGVKEEDGEREIKRAKVDVGDVDTTQPLSSTDTELSPSSHHSNTQDEECGSCVSEPRSSEESRVLEGQQPATCADNTRAVPDLPVFPKELSSEARSNRRGKGKGKTRRGRAAPVPPTMNGETSSDSAASTQDGSEEAGMQGSEAVLEEYPGLGYGVPTTSGVVYSPDEATLAAIRPLQQHFEDLKRTYLLLQGITRGLQHGSSSAGPSVHVDAPVLPEVWRPFDSSKYWPLCIFYRNPALDKRLYTACRSGDSTVYGDATSPREEDPVWQQLMQTTLVDTVVEYVDQHSEKFGLGNKVPFSIQALWYNKKTRKSEHKDPRAYTVISALNVCGKADLELYDPRRRRTQQATLLPEGSMYIMHNEAVSVFDHAVSAPRTQAQGGLSQRITIVLRFIDKESLDELMNQVARMEQAEQPSQSQGASCKDPTSSKSSSSVASAASKKKGKSARRSKACLAGSKKSKAGGTSKNAKKKGVGGGKKKKTDNNHSVKTTKKKGAKNKAPA